LISDFGKPILALVFAGALTSPAISDARIPLDGASVEACFTPGNDCAALVVSAISSARQRVWLLGYGFTEDRIVGALLAARRRGADVRLILDRSNADGGMRSAAAYIAKQGIPVRIDRTVRIAHNKLILIDGDAVIMGSLNWTKAGNRMNAENVHILRGAKPLADRHAAYFLEREAVSEIYKVEAEGPRTR
jgi:phosphatidylserine/phosphatidylglycerophosphate/cardiolipin synthase-like enzyme